MGTTFLAQKTNGTKKIALVLKEFHVNIWHISKKEMFLDLGLLLEVPLVKIPDCIDFDLQLPFRVEGDAVDLTPKLHQREIIDLLFNENYNKTELTHNKSTIVNVELTSSNRGDFTLISPCIETLGNSSLSLSYASEELLFASKRLKRTDVINVYSRIRIKIDVKNSFGIELLKKELHDEVLYDIRLNDTRQLENAQEAYSNMISVERFLLFLITPAHYAITLEPSKYKKHVRRLEEEWQTYLPQLSVKSSPYFVNYWRANEVGQLSQNFLVRAQREKTRPWERFKIVFYISVALFLVTDTLTSVDVDKALELFTLPQETVTGISEYYSATVNSFLPILSGLLLAVIANAIWSLVSITYNLESLFSKIFKKK